MKKFLLFLLVLIIIILGAIYALLFSNAGNAFIAKYAQNQLNIKVPGLIIKNFKLRPSSLDLDASYLDMIDLNLGGELQLSKLSLNLVYSITSKNLESLNIKESIKANGHIIGRYDDLTIDASGDILGSKLSASAKLKDYKPSAMNLLINDLALGKLAMIARYPVLDGSINIDAKANNLEQIEANLSGWLQFLKAANNLSGGVALSSLGKLNLSAKASANNSPLQASAQISSKLLNIKASDIKLNKDTLTALIEANSPDISWINPALHTNLALNAQLKKIANQLEINATAKGKNLNANKLVATIDLAKLSASAQAQISANAALVGLKDAKLADASIQAQVLNGALNSANASGIVLGGNLIAKLSSDRLSASLKHASIDQALAISNLAAAINGDFDADVNIAKLSQLSGDIKLKLNSKTNPNYFNKELNLAINSPLNADIFTKLNGANDIGFNINATSALINTLNIKGKLKNSALFADYEAASELANFNQLLNKNMSGKINLNGKLKASAAKLEASLHSSDFLGSKLAANLDGKDFKATITNANLPRFAKAFGFADVYFADANAKINYNLGCKCGHINADLSKGHLQPHPLINLINAVSGSNINKIIFEKGLANIDLKANKALINAELSAQNAYLKAQNGSYEFASTALDIPIDAKLNTTEIKGSLKGTAQKAKFVPDAANLVGNLLHLANKFNKPNEAATNEQPANEPAKKDVKNAIGGLLNNLIRR